MCLNITVENALAAKKILPYKGRDCFILFRKFRYSYGRFYPGDLEAETSQYFKSPYRVTRMYGKTYSLRPNLEKKQVMLSISALDGEHTRSFCLQLPRLGMCTYAIPNAGLFDPAKSVDGYGYYYIPMLVDTTDVQIAVDKNIVVVKRGIFPSWEDMKPLLAEDLGHMVYFHKPLGRLLHADPGLGIVEEKYRKFHKLLEHSRSLQREEENSDQGKITEALNS